MGKDEKRIRKPPKLIVLSISFVFCSVILIISSILTINSNKHIRISIKAVNEEIESKNNSINEYNKQNKVLEERINFLNNIDKNIKNLKNEYFEDAKKLEEKVQKNETDVKIMYMTFDDGPYNLTTKYLDVLDKYNVKATFFVLGKPDYIDTYKRIKDSGHSIGNHTYYHNIFKGLYSSSDSFITQVNMLEKYLKENVGYTTNIVRFPGGSTTAGKYLREEIINKLKEKGYGYVNWDGEVGDGNGLAKTPKQAYDMAIRTVNNEKITILLMHDYSENTIVALPDIIEYFKSQNYIFLPLYKDSIKIMKE